MPTFRGRSTFAILAATGVWASVPAAAEDLRTPLIAQSCAGCHGQQGAGEGRVPRISGYDRNDFLLVWERFRSGEEAGTIMGRIARGYDEAEIAALADYFAQR